jgi:transposase
LPDGQAASFANDKAGHKALIAFIGKADVARVVFEPTGPYHRVFEAVLAKAGLPLVKVNPRQARRFAEAIGKFVKTDRIDAANLARMGALLALEVRHPQPEILNELKELYVAREALVKDRTAAKNRQKQLTLALLKRQNTQRLTQIERTQEKLETLHKQ